MSSSNLTTEAKLFSSLKYAKILEDAGLPRKQAETHIQILGDLIGEEMATKEDFKRIEQTIKHYAQIAKQDTENLSQSTKKDIAHLAESTRQEFKRFEGKMTYEIQSSENRITLKLGGLMTAFLATGLTAAKLFLI